MIEKILTCCEQKLSVMMWYDQAGFSLWWAFLTVRCAPLSAPLKSIETSIISVTKHDMLWYSLFSTDMGMRSIEKKKAQATLSNMSEAGQLQCTIEVQSLLMILLYNSTQLTRLRGCCPLLGIHKHIIPPAVETDFAAH
jgi:hypothetical protein